ncbi:MAG: YerC/YecD family TrpR-related protein [Acidimicrobiia bacterium]
MTSGPANADEWRNESTAALMDTIIGLDDRDSAARFFRDLCTRRELEEMTARWAVVRSLGEGHPYREIHDLTGVSTATITRIAQWVRHGTGGYIEALERAGYPTGGI